VTPRCSCGCAPRRPACVRAEVSSEPPVCGAGETGVLVYIEGQAHLVKTYLAHAATCVGTALLKPGPFAGHVCLVPSAVTPARRRPPRHLKSSAETWVCAAPGGRRRRGGGRRGGRHPGPGRPHHAGAHLAAAQARPGCWAGTLTLCPTAAPGKQGSLQRARLKGTCMHAPPCLHIAAATLAADSGSLLNGQSLGGELEW